MLRNRPNFQVHRATFANKQRKSKYFLFWPKYAFYRSSLWLLNPFGVWWRLNVNCLLSVVWKKMESNTVGFKQSHLEKLLLTKNELAPLNRRRSSSYRKQSHCVCQPGISLTVSPTPFFFSFIFTLFLFLPPFSDVREVLGKKTCEG
jgi:hypothetical protein